MDGGGEGKTTTFNDLPFDIVTDILSRLPAKTLIRFSSVRKSWYSLVRNPTFISKHLTHHSLSSHLLILPEVLFAENQCCLLLDGGGGGTFTFHSAFDFPIKTDTMTVEILGSCRGLVCLTDRLPFNYGREGYLWNPSIRRYKSLPPSRFAKRLSDWKTSYAVIGFGFCESENDFRVVRLVYFADDCFDFMGKKKPEVEVYSLKSGKWRKVGGVVPRTAHSGSVAFAKGAVHWLAAIKAFCSFEVIMAFDLKDEVFREMKLPTKLRNRGAGKSMDSDSLRVMEFNGSVSLFHYRLANDERCYVWWMRKYGDAKSWTKQFTIVPQGKVERALGFTKSGMILLEMNDEKLVSYDPERKRFVDLGFQGLYGAHGAYVESLVMLEQQKGIFFF